MRVIVVGVMLLVGALASETFALVERPPHAISVSPDGNLLLQSTSGVPDLYIDAAERGSVFVSNQNMTELFVTIRLMADRIDRLTERVDALSTTTG